jgi:hypothetical protein
MQKRRSTRRGDAGTRTDETDGGLVAAVAELGQRFAAFRSQNRAYARVPAELQTAVARVARRGATERELRDACGISAVQFRRWTSNESDGSRRSPETLEQLNDAQFFDVVEGIYGRPSTTVVGSCDSGQGLELRLGPWSIRVCMAGQ